MHGLNELKWIEINFVVAPFRYGTPLALDQFLMTPRRLSALKSGLRKLVPSANEIAVLNLENNLTSNIRLLHKVETRTSKVV